MVDLTPEAIKYGFLVGMTLEEAYRTTGLPIRVRRVNGEYCLVSADYVPNRLNVEIENNIIVHIIGCG